MSPERLWLRQLHLEAVAMSREAEGVVEPVCAFALEVAGERHLVAGGEATLFQGMLHHGAAYAVSLAFGMDGDSFDDACLLTSFGHVVEDREFVCTDDELIEYGYEHLEVGIALEEGEVRYGFFDGETGSAVDSGIPVETEDCGDVVFGCGADSEIGHGDIVAGSVVRLVGR